LGQLTHPAGCFVEGVRSNDEVVFSAFTPTGYESHSVEYGQMLGHCLAADRKVFRENRCCCFTAHREQLEQVSTRRIGERCQDLGDAHDEETNGCSSLPMTYSANLAMTPVQPFE